jgi:ParB family chromosome partitioning protein
VVLPARRWRAAKLVGLTEIPAVIKDLSDREAVAVALIDLQREELTPAEEARSLRRLTAEFSLTHQEVAVAVGRSRAAVSNLIRLLDLPDEVVALIDAKSISMGHARALLGLEDDAERLRVATLVAERGLSVRETENLVRKALKGEGSESPKKPPELVVVSEVLKTPFVQVQMQLKASGAGKLIVEFKDSVTRDEVIAAIRGAPSRSLQNPISGRSRDRSWGVYVSYSLGGVLVGAIGIAGGHYSQDQAVGEEVLRTLGV